MVDLDALDEAIVRSPSVLHWAVACPQATAAALVRVVRAALTFTNDATREDAAHASINLREWDELAAALEPFRKDAA